ncbi:MAG: 16S rRNA (guanine(966)-N(2))-methyltransferase RsmD [Gammaproteobacteria bacterium]|nr:MAG: 16S rRNA (guanine(966)-N(2))-methyltransferase RsmD [Gammaproteobacteria bacterium]
MVARSKTTSKINRKSSGSIRIIAGKYRGRKLPVLDAQGLRPTTDRVKETLFNWLMPYINETNCLDCFAGSGGLGFEALSRGATKVVFLELNKNAADQLKQNVVLLKDLRAEVIQTNSIEFLKPNNANKQLFDLVFIDPPFRQQLLNPIVENINHGWLAQNALIYIECEAELDVSVLPINLQLLKEKIAGQVAYRLYQAAEMTF